MPLTDPVVLGAIAAFVLAIIAIGVVLLLRRRRPRTKPGEGGASWVSGLAKTRGNLAQRLLASWRGPGSEDAWLGEVEEILLSADVGVNATRALLESIRPQLSSVDGPEALRDLLKQKLRDLFGNADAEAPNDGKPRIILVVGVNGVGKTTTIGKLADRLRREGKKVLLVAGDTFRAAAIDQLARWAERVQADLVKHQQGADPSAVVFDGVQAGIARGADVVIVDTAGRLHVKENLMQEVKKIARTVSRQIPEAPHEVLLVIDATTGQNALAQARVFHEALQLTGVVLAKLDGTAKGGIALAIRSELGLPVRYVGLGERPEDLAPFDADEFVAALFDPVPVAVAAAAQV